MSDINVIWRINDGYVIVLKSSPICKHIAKASRANAPTKALSDGSKPQFETIMKVLRAIGGQIQINPVTV
jgi:hypothetical protein